LLTSDVIRATEPADLVLGVVAFEPVGPVGALAGVGGAGLGRCQRRPLSAITPSNLVAKISSARSLMEILLPFIPSRFLAERSFLSQHHDGLP
jgi:hypothetical protein